jgi:hypothetical protein
MYPLRQGWRVTLIILQVLNSTCTNEIPAILVARTIQELRAGVMLEFGRIWAIPPFWQACAAFERREKS